MLLAAWAATSPAGYGPSTPAMPPELLYPGCKFQIAVMDETILDYPPSVAPRRVWISEEQYGR
jgi:hypothetical protein